MLLDATAQATAIKSGELTAHQILEETISRIQERNPRLNALISTQFDDARQVLNNMSDDTIQKLPFAGVPILLKDLGQSQEGQLNTSGSRLFKDYKSQITDNYVKSLEDLGFIIMGRTNTPEFGFKNISDSELHGPVNLPADHKRNAGGSSGGAASAVSSGIIAIACASDGGGSIRIPASFNGLIGLKPTRGRLPVGPLSYRGWQGASVSFVLTQSVRDTQSLLYHLQNLQMESPFPLPKLSKETIFNNPLQNPLKIAVLTASPIGSSVSSDAKNAVLEVSKVLSEIGHDIITIDDWPIDGIGVMRAYYLMNSVETAAMFDGIEQLFKRKMTRNDMELMTWAIYQSGQKIPAKTYSHVLDEWDQYSVSMAHFHEEYDILLTPTTNGPAPLHGQFDLSDNLKNQLLDIENKSISDQQDLIWEMFADSLAWTPYTQLANLTGQPALSLPTYRTSENLPMGIQVMAAKGREDLLLNLAQQLEAQGILKIGFD